ncbi:SRP54-type protein [Suillus subaureus]|uniref:SRP54-type protein n=1 Tax=Suillus subaureus TaxID=48587 RepID=A0A9P7AU44_9AGAM|nr:SRP54-type protein [Suillus subaureus]KAG1795831.1 SRP54-type protein [Suillus subaureus]
MLDHCSISHKAKSHYQLQEVLYYGHVPYPRGISLGFFSSSPVNSLIREALIEGRTAEEKYEKDGYAVKWTFFNDLELILWYVAYHRILQLTYVDDLLAALKALFIKLFEPFLATFVASLHAIKSGKLVSGAARDSAKTWNFAKAFEGWDGVFDKLLKGFEDKAAQVLPSESSIAVQDEQQIARNVQALKNRLRGRGGRRGGRGVTRVDSGSGRDSVPASDSESTSKRAKSKAQRKWGESAPSETEMASLDFSIDKPDSGTNGHLSHDLQALVDKASLGTRTRDGLYEVKDWDFGGKDDESNDAITRALKNEGAKQPSGSLGALSSLFSRLTGSKNLNRTGFEASTSNAVRTALSSSLTRILTPKTSTDLLLSIRTKLSSPLPSAQQRMPYSITFVGVNGVGKSTNLSKVCFWLIQNGLRVLIAACDTFRSGAVEQLRVHVRNLSMLGVNGATNSKGRVELYEKGYGKDAAGIAKEAIAYAKDNDFDVVLIDTAGRMQDNEPLMRALAKLVAANNPDKIIFVGEALVGNEAVDQLTKFDRALRDFSSASGSGKGRGIDGMLVTKWDTVDDKVGAALSMTYVTGQPIIFVGCGQTYTDLRQLRVANVVQAILSD